ncbi:MAG: 2-succinyl-5-enolpyruvyl-6-hydroxy-3-cyclohexene-1-carboxylic-acid synthase [Balneola sp.]
MPENETQNLAFYWSTLFVRSLFVEGVRNVVISPGSRSTPLTLAFSAHPGISKTIAVDERSAAFIALGQAKASGVPSVLVCTSGTALANYAPAVFEATNSGIPMIIASADRPPHLRGLGASQTIDQVKIFGRQPVFFHEAGEPSTHAEKQKRVPVIARQAFQRSLEDSGVSHINFAFDKPFEPEDDFLKKIESENQNHSNRSQTEYSQNMGETELGEKFWSQLISAEYPLIIVGATSSATETGFITPLARALSAPIIAEPGSNVPNSRHIISGYAGFLKDSEYREDLKPDLILRIGSFPVSKGVQQLLEECNEIHQIGFTESRFPNDGDYPTDRTIQLNSPLTIPDINGNASSKWLSKWKKISKKFNSFLVDQIQPSTPLTDGYVFKETGELIPKKAFTMLSNSFPVRDLALFTDFSGQEIYVNRGAAGIDGIISTTIGLSSILDKQGVLFIGDIAFLHDINAFLSIKEVTNPLVIVILNNGGGTIFRMLPVYKFKQKHRQYFETPQDVRIVSLCRGYQIDHTLVSKPEQFAPAFESYIDKPGVHVIECITDADDSMIERHKLWNFSLSSQDDNKN